MFNCADTSDRDPTNEESHKTELLEQIKTELLEQIKNDANVFENLHPFFKNDTFFVIEAIKSNTEVYQLIDIDWHKKYKDVLRALIAKIDAKEVLDKINQNIWEKQKSPNSSWVTEKKNISIWEEQPQEILLLAIAKCHEVILNAPQHLRLKSDFILDAVKQNGKVLEILKTPIFESKISSTSIFKGIQNYHLFLWRVNNLKCENNDEARTKWVKKMFQNEALYFSTLLMLFSFSCYAIDLCIKYLPLDSYGCLFLVLSSVGATFASIFMLDSVNKHYNSFFEAKKPLDESSSTQNYAELTA